MKEYYYLDLKRKVQGPHTLDELAGKLRSGELSVDTEVAAPGDARWVALGSLVTNEQVAAAKLPPAPVVAGAPGKCPSCTAELKTEDGVLPPQCAQCGRVLRPAKGGFWGDLLLPLLQYAKFSGRATRAEYWIFTLLVSLVLYGGIIAGLIVALVGLMQPGHNENLLIGGGVAILAGGGLLLLALMPLVSVQVRRLHDAGFSGWWVGAYYLCELAYLVGLYGFCWDVWQMMNKTVEQGLMNGDASWLRTLQMTMQTNASPEMTAVSMLNFVGQMLWLFIFIVSFFDSQRGPNKYGPSRKYPLG